MTKIKLKRDSSNASIIRDMPEPEAIYAMIEAARNGDGVAESSIHRAFVHRLVALATRYIARGQPFGNEKWQQRIAKILGLESSLRPPGRPRKQ